ncbi:hypothetical protein ACHAXR_013408 [Thalassiosira sp. AJA248-18]
MAFSFKQLPLISCLQCFLFLSRMPLFQCSSAGSGGGIGTGGRHSYSLSTFSPSGDIDQVVRAMRASMLGVPIVALSIPPVDEVPTTSDVPTSAIEGEIESDLETSAPSSKGATAKIINPLPSQGGIYLSMPLRFLTTSPFLIDDGTRRVTQIASSICVTHTGVGADGRVLCDMAIKLALDYRYMYGEEISVEELLEGLAEKVQEMTMKPGSRPFGSALLVGCLGSDCGHGNSRPTMYRVDPSGAVVMLSSFDHRDGFHPGTSKDLDQETIEDVGRRGSVAFLGNWDPLRQKKDDIRSQLENQQFTNEKELQDSLIDAARQTYIDDIPMSEENPSKSTGRRLNQPILFASFTRERGLQISHIMNHELHKG